MSLEGKIKTGFGVIAIINIAIIALIIWGVIAGVKYVKKNGLKGAVETVWEGDAGNTNAPPANVSTN